MNTNQNAVVEYIRTFIRHTGRRESEVVDILSAMSGMVGSRDLSTVFVGVSQRPDGELLIYAGDSPIYAIDDQVVILTTQPGKMFFTKAEHWKGALVEVDANTLTLTISFVADHELEIGSKSWAGFNAAGKAVNALI